MLLREAGSAFDAAGVELLIEGVLAAPSEVGTSWHVLVADPLPGALAGQLESLRAAIAAGYRDGLSAEDFKRLPRPGRLDLLRQELAARRLDAFIVPRADEHQGEYVPPCGQRLTWLTGFTGSAGLAIVLRDRAALFVDGRYTLQAAAQVDTSLFEIHHLIDEPPARWVAAALKPGAVLAYDPWLHTPHEVERFRAAAEKAGATLRAVAENPLDRVWPGRPAAPIAPVVPHPERFAGESAKSKRTRIGPRAGGGGGCRRRPDNARIDRLAPQHPRRGCAAYPAPVVVCDPPRGTARSCCSSTGASSSPASSGISETRSPSSSPEALGPALDELAAEGGAGAGRPGERGIVGFRPVGSGGREDPSRRRSLPAAKGVQELGRDVTERGRRIAATVLP